MFFLSFIFLLVRVGADLNGRQVFPPNNPWNTDISQMPVDPNSDTLIKTIGGNSPLHPDFGTKYHGEPNGIPYNLVLAGQPPVNVVFQLPEESDPGPYPIPPNASIEGGEYSTGDRHVLTIDQDAWMLYEMYDSYEKDGGQEWDAYSGAVFNLSSNALRPICWTSADAAGLPIFPGLVRYDEVSTNSVNHAFRFTVEKTRKGFIDPARHYASSITSSSYPPMGMRVRLKASYNISHFSETNQVILQALKTYGMLLADNGGNWFLSGAPSPLWDDDDLHKLTNVEGSDFEVVQMGDIVTSC